MKLSSHLDVFYFFASILNVVSEGSASHVRCNNLVNESVNRPSVMSPCLFRSSILLWTGLTRKPSTIFCGLHSTLNLYRKDLCVKRTHRKMLVG